MNSLPKFKNLDKTKEKIVDDAKTKRWISVKAKEQSIISVVVPLQNKTAWVVAEGDKHLSLIDSKGDVITQSVILDYHIYDAKEYNNGLLITCIQGCKVFKISSEGTTTSIFSDLSPYNTRGLCVTHEMDVMVCLISPHSNDNKVVRLGEAGEIKQTVNSNSSTGVSLYRDPLSVTTLTTGDIIVADWSQPDRIIGVDIEAQHLFTWQGEINGEKLFYYSVQCITHDSNNNLLVTDYWNDSVFMLRKDGTRAKILIDSDGGIKRPMGIAIDSDGYLWLGCYDGKVYIIEY